MSVYLVSFKQNITYFQSQASKNQCRLFVNMTNTHIQKLFIFYPHWDLNHGPLEPTASVLPKSSAEPFKARNNCTVKYSIAALLIIMAFIFNSVSSCQFKYHLIGIRRNLIYDRQKRKYKKIYFQKMHHFIFLSSYTFTKILFDQ